MKKITKWLLVVSLVWGTTVFTACSNDGGSSAESFNAAEELSGEKFLHDEWMDRSVKPGDSFWKYALGKWLKKHSKSDLGVWLNTQQEITQSLHSGLSKYKNSTVAGHVLKLLTGTKPSSAEEGAVLREVLAKIKTDDDADLIDLIHDAGALADLRIFSLFGHEFFNKDGKYRYMVTPGYNALPFDELSSPEDAMAYLGVLYKLLGEDSSTPEVKEEMEAIVDLDLKMYLLIDEWTEPVPSAKGRRLKKSVVPVQASISAFTAIKSLSLGDKDLTKAFREAFHIDNQTYYMPQIDQVFEIMSEYDIKILQKYMKVYAVSRLSRTMFSVGYTRENIYELMNEMEPSLFAEYINETLCKKADVEGARQMLEDMRTLMAERINNVDWLSASTKKNALEKLNAMIFNVGTPETMFNADFKLTGKTPIEDFVQYCQQLDDYVRNTLSGKKVDDHGWDFLLASSGAGASISQVNAMYVVITNQIYIFPTFLHENLFPADKDDVMRYVTLSIFGHEMTHAFDAMGALYDKDGMEKDWWTVGDKSNFEERQQEMVERFSELELLPGLQANGEQTLDENIADFGGFNLAWQMWNKKLEADGLTGEELRHQQRQFFLEYAYLWQVDDDQATLLNDYETDEHSANHIRVNGMVRLMDDWYTLFDVQPDDELYVKPEDRVKIW